MSGRVQRGTNRRPAWNHHPQSIEPSILTKANTDTPSVGIGTSQYGRDYRLGYRLGLLERGGLDFGLDVSGTRRESVMTPVPDHQVMTSATVTW